MKDKIIEYLRKYIAVKTHTGTSLENNTRGFYEEYFNDIDYFKNNPDNCGFYKIKGDHLDRHIPWGLLKGEGNDTIILVHHSDTVDVEDYGINKDFAHDPFRITKIYKEGNTYLDEDTQEDLDSGKWLFGRGVADMKGGACIHLALLEKYAYELDFKGNLLLIAVPDEENLSAGMRGAIPLLKELKDKHDLNYLLLLNVEPHEREDEEVGTIYDGSVGKLMPLIYIRGKLAHVGQIYQGFNPVNLLSEIVRRTEINADFIETVGNSSTFPPTWLYAKDRKEIYDVSIPPAAVGYMSLLTLDRAPKDIFEKFYNIVDDSFEKVIEDMNISYRKYQEITGKGSGTLPWVANTKYYSELYRDAVRDYGEEFINSLNVLMKEIKEKIIRNEITMIQASYGIIEKTLEYVKDLSPMAIIALAPPYYPNVNNGMLKTKASPINNAIADIINFAREEFQQEYSIQNYFTGISDLSYAMFEADEESIKYIEDNMLMWKDIYYIPLEDIKELSIPVLNLGPWGKDFHKYTERVNIEDLFYRTPLLINKLVKVLIR